jgi:uncharacterized Zn finger protein (UPF0148 family)
MVDGSSMFEVDGGVQCPVCGRLLSGALLYELIELNPHPSAP